MTDNERQARALLASTRFSTLSVIDAETGYPSGSLVTHAVDQQGRPILLISTLARHTRALAADKRASLLVQSLEAQNSLSGLRASFQGRLERLPRSPGLEALWATTHPDSSIYMGLADFDFWRMEPELIHIVAGFGRIETVRL